MHNIGLLISMSKSDSFKGKNQGSNNITPLIFVGSSYDALYTVPAPNECPATIILF